jgi:magnesium-protoporphyrin IX monomethyl ester (oxidative) cyclase
MERLRVLGIANEAARETGGVVATLRRIGYGIAAAAMFARLYTLPVVRNETPAQVRMAPAW